MFKIKTRQIGFDKISAELKARILRFAALLTIGGISYVICAYNLLASESDMYSHVPVTFAISGYVLFRERGNIFGQAVDAFLHPLLYSSWEMRLKAALPRMTTSARFHLLSSCI